MRTEITIDESTHRRTTHEFDMQPLNPYAPISEDNPIMLTLAEYRVQERKPRARNWHTDEVWKCRGRECDWGPARVKLTAAPEIPRQVVDLLAGNLSRSFSLRGVGPL